MPCFPRAVHPGSQAFVDCTCAITKIWETISVNPVMGGLITDILVGRRHLVSVSFGSHSQQLFLLAYKEMGRRSYTFLKWLWQAENSLLMLIHVNVKLFAFPYSQYTSKGWALINATWSYSPERTHWRRKMKQKPKNHLYQGVTGARSTAGSPGAGRAGCSSQDQTITPPWARVAGGSPRQQTPPWEQGWERLGWDAGLWVGVRIRLLTRRRARQPQHWSLKAICLRKCYQKQNILHSFCLSPAFF